MKKCKPGWLLRQTRKATASINKWPKWKRDLYRLEARNPR